jgi:hypothetical protein
LTRWPKRRRRCSRRRNPPRGAPTTATTPAGSVVISGTGLGLPGANKPVMDPDNALRILRGEQFVDLIPERFRKQMVEEAITRLVKSEDGSGSFETIDDPAEVIKLAGRPGAFDLAEEYGVPAKLIEALDITTQLAMAAGLDALREAGIPLVQTYRTHQHRQVPARPLAAARSPARRDRRHLRQRLPRRRPLRRRVQALLHLREPPQAAARNAGRPAQLHRDPATLREIGRRIGELRDELEREPYEFDRRFIFRILAMGHSQFAEYIGARGPNTHVNAACASTAQAIAMAEDWIRSGRCRRVVVIGADDVTGENLMEWVGAGFLAVGAAATDDQVEEAALPFDRAATARSGHGRLRPGGRKRGRRPRARHARHRRAAEQRNRNSAFHGTRLDVNHICDGDERLVTAAERRFGLNRYAIAPQTVFMSHETFTPARGGSAAAEVTALRHTFGEAANEIIICNTKGFTGHPMGVGVEDVIAVKILEYGIVPPVPNFREVDPTWARST